MSSACRFCFVYDVSTHLGIYQPLVIRDCAFLQRQGKLPAELDSAVRDMATMLTIATSLVPQFRIADQATATTGIQSSDINPADASAFCDTTLALLHALLTKRCHVRGHTFVELMVCSCVWMSLHQHRSACAVVS